MAENNTIQIVPMEIQATTRGEIQIENNENTSYVSFNFTITNKVKAFRVFKKVLIVMSALLLVISFILNIVNSFQVKKLATLASILLIITYATTIYLIVCIKRDQAKYFQHHDDTLSSSSSWSAKQQQQQDAKTNLIKSQLILATFFIILGFSDSLYNLTSFLDRIFFVINDQFDFTQCGYSSLISVCIQNFAQIFYQLFILMFILQYENYYYAMSRQRVFSKLILAYLALSFLTQWFSIVISEVHDDTCAVQSNNSTLTANITTFEAYDAIFYPLAIEFRIYCLMELLYMYFSILKINNSLKDHGSELVATDAASENDSDSEDDQLDHHHHRNNRKHTDFYNLPITFGIFLTSFTIGFIFFQRKNSDSNSLVLITNEIFEVAILFLCFLTIVVLLRRMWKAKVSFLKSFALSIWPLHKFRCKKRSWKSNDSITIEAKIDLLALNVSSACLIVYTGLSISTIVNFINTSSTAVYTEQTKYAAKILALVTLIFVLVQTILQNFVISFLIHNNQRCYYFSQKLIKALILFNFTLWLIDTFSAKKYLIVDTWTSTIGPVIIPLVILYRFQTCIILIKVLFDKYELSVLPIQYRISLYRPITIISDIVDRY